MPNELPDPSAPPVADETTQQHGLENGFQLVLEAEDHNDWKPVAHWLAHNPALAGDVAQFLDDQEKMRDALPLPVVPDRAGTGIGGLEIKEKIGEGGMGVVYRAYDPRLNRDVAVKMVRTTGPLSAADLARFRFEAEMVAALNHPNIVPVHSFGETDGAPYLVMPLMTGGSLAARLKNLGPDRCRPGQEAAELVREIARGVHHAHLRGLIHRDLKPANILLDRDGVPHIADFGLARPIDVSLSGSGGIAGTAAYMAPEQARGDKGLTTAVDVHALGAILFELLTGRTPFGGADLPSVLRRVTEEPAPPVRALRPDVHRDLELICAKCLSKAPQDRYPSAQALGEDLDRFLNGEPPSGSGRAWLWDIVGRAMGRRRETLGMTSWRVAFWGAASTALAMGVMQAAVLLDAPLWVSQAAVAYYLIAWLGLMWGFLVARRDALNPVEQASTAIHFGAKFSCIAILPVQMWLHGGNPVYALPSFLVLVGLATFVHGVTYWGRLYLSGSAILAVAAAMPLIPVTYWPAVYGVLLTALQALMGFHLRRVHKQAEAARRADPSTG